MIKFSSIKEMQIKLQEVTSLNDLKQDINVATQGVFVTLKFINIGEIAGTKELFYISDDGILSAKVRFIDNGTSISVNEVKVSRP